MDDPPALSPAGTPIRMVIVEGHPFFRDVLVRFLADHADLQVVGTMARLPRSMAKLAALKPDVIIIDPKPTDMTVGKDIRLQRRAFQSMGSVVLSLPTEPEYEQVATQAGADAFVDKQRASVELISRIRQAARRGQSPPAPLAGDEMAGRGVAGQ